jgi:primary-amine oxidase
MTSPSIDAGPALAETLTEPSACCAAAPAHAAGRPHPHAPLSPDEIRAVVAIVRADARFGAAVMFETIEVKEPERAILRAGGTPPREARANLFRPDETGVIRLTVSLDDGVVASAVRVEGARPMIQLEEFMAIEGVVRADPDFIAACARRGITDMSLVCVDPWSAGNFGVAGEEGLHLSHTSCARTRTSTPTRSAA